MIPLPEPEQPLDENPGRGRRRTVKEKGQGQEILQRAKTATTTREISEEIEQASILRLKAAGK